MLFGDDIDLRARAIEVDLAGFSAMMFMLRRSGHGTSAFNRARQAASVMAGGGRRVVQQMAEHCAAAGSLASRLGPSEDVRAGIEQAYARWDGQGVPDDLSGTGVSLAARVSQVAEACEVFERTAGVKAAVDVVRSRSGTHFDPEIAKLLSTDDELDHALAAIGDFCDLRCPFFAGHARGTAELVRGAAQVMNLPAVDAYCAMLKPRPYRRPLSEADAVRELQADATAGRLDPVATEAVLVTAGHRVSRSRARGPAGLTTRESDVLALLAQGMPNKSIARELGISPKTVSNHVEHVYSKLGVTNRTGAAMYAMQYGIVGSGAPASGPSRP